MTARRPQILQVDDSAADVLLMRTAVRELELPCDLHVAGDGEQALVALRRGAPDAATGRFDLVLLDLNLPRKGGFEVLAEMRADPDLAPTAVIIMTTSTADADVEKAYGLGANAFVVKPVDYGHFLDSVQAIGEFWMVVARLPGTSALGAEPAAARRSTDTPHTTTAATGEEN